MKAPICPTCRQTAATTKTKYGKRHECCGLHSWDGKPLVSQAVHDARQRFHEAFDRLWKNAETAYDIDEAPGSEAYQKAVSKIRKSARNRAYLFLSNKTGLPEPECHGGAQENVSKLDDLTEAAALCSGPDEVRRWFKKHKAPAQYAEAANA